MSYHITETEDGRYVVTENVPVEIARFSSPTHARMFVRRVLEADAPGAGEAAAEAAPEARANLLAFGGFTGELMRATKDVLNVEPEPEEAATALEPEAEAAGDPWEIGMRRIARGEDMKQVAREMGLSWTSLRARWSYHRVRILEEIAQEIPFEPAKAEMPVHGGPVPVRQRPRLVGNDRARGDDAEPEDDGVRGRPDLVARKEAVWTDELDLEVIQAGDDEEALMRIAMITGASLQRVERRQRLLLERTAREMRQ